MPRVRQTALIVCLSLCALLAGCVPTSALRMHDLFLYGDGDVRISHIYGEAGQLLYAGSTVSLTVPTQAEANAAVPYAVSTALLIDGRPYLREALQPLAQQPIEVSRLAFTTDLRLTVNADVLEVVYFDGSSFLRLLSEAQAGTTQTVVPRPRLNGLRGFGQLSTAEADALSAQLVANRQPFALALLPLASLPTHAVDGLAEHRRTGVFVQRHIAVDNTASAPVPQQLIWDVVAQGNQAVGVSGPRYELITSQAQLTSLWQLAHGAQLTVPQLPSLDFRRETVVALFMGSRSTGGYGINVHGVREENGGLYVDVAFSQPGGGEFTSQALTSPWLIMRVQRAGYSAAWLRTPGTGDLIGVARAAD